MEILRITFAANQRKRFERAGRYMEIISSSAPITIDLYNRDGADVAGAVNALSGLFMEGEFSSFNIHSATAQTIEVMVTDGRGGSRRQPGIVKVYDSAREIVFNNGKFLNSASFSPNAGKFAHAQIWNQSTSKYISLNRLTINKATVSAQAGIFHHTAKIVGTEFHLTSRLVTTPLQSQFTEFKTIRGITASSDVPVGGTNRLNGYISTSTTDNVSIDLTDGPFVIGPGAGLTIAMTAADIPLSIIFGGDIFDGV